MPDVVERVSVKLASLRLPTLSEVVPAGERRVLVWDPKCLCRIHWLVVEADDLSDIWITEVKVGHNSQLREPWKLTRPAPLYEGCFETIEPGIHLTVYIEHRGKGKLSQVVSVTPMGVRAER